MRGGTVAYIVSRDAARHFVDLAAPITGGVDWPDCTKAIVARRHWRIVHPLLCHHPSHREQRDGQSILLTQSFRDPECLVEQHQKWLQSDSGLDYPLKDRPMTHVDTPMEE